MGVTYSFTAWRGTYFAGADHFWQAFVGFDNYIAAFKTKNFINAFIYTVKFTVVAVIVINVVSLVMALGYIWAFIFEIIFSKILFGETGFLSIPALCNMTQDNTKALFALTMLVTWQMAGYMMIIYTSGLNNIPTELMEAASIDGATKIQKFFRITVPMLMPSFTVVFFMTLANCFKLQDQNIALTDGKFDTRMLALQILRTVKETVPDVMSMHARHKLGEVIVWIVLILLAVYTIAPLLFLLVNSFKSNAEIVGNPSFHDIYYDGANHYYIDGTVLDSGVIPVLMVDTDTDKYYRVTETGNWLILPYEEEN